MFLFQLPTAQGLSHNHIQQKMTEKAFFFFSPETFILDWYHLQDQILKLAVQDLLFVSRIPNSLRNKHPSTGSQMNLTPWFVHSLTLATTMTPFPDSQIEQREVQGKQTNSGIMIISQ